MNMVIGGDWDGAKIEGVAMMPDGREFALAARAAGASGLACGIAAACAALPGCGNSNSFPFVPKPRITL